MKGKTPSPTNAVEWKISTRRVEYPCALKAMEKRVADIAQGAAPEKVWLLTHPPLYTSGTSAKASDLLDPRFPVYDAGRGGQYTYHGPGQRVGYVMLNLKQRNMEDLSKYVHHVEEWLIEALRLLGVESFTRKGRVGIWVNTPAGEAKIGAIGIRVRKWVTFHGFSLNINPDLSHFSGIVPCGISEYGVTSLHALGLRHTTKAVDEALQAAFKKVFE